MTRCDRDDDPTQHDVPRRKADLSAYRDVKGFERYQPAPCREGVLSPSRQAAGRSGIPSGGR